MKYPSAKDNAIWTVSALNFEVKTMLTEGIGSLWIEGEISNLARPASGHWYFSLKDNKAQCRAAMFKGKNQRVTFKPENGQKVLVRAQVTLYEARGEFQLVVDHLEDAGIGELMRQYEQMKNLLDAEGLFSPDRKKPIPTHPAKIGIITSPTGAAIRDAISVIKRRAPHIPVIIYPSSVQGEKSVSELTQALSAAIKHNECDVLLIIRGGGSLEDLWSFNNENFIRQIADCPIPVISGIGHEIDFTLTDFVADLRAPTPSVAAESITPDSLELMQDVDYLLTKLIKNMSQKLIESSKGISSLSSRLEQQHPTRQFAQFAARLNYARNGLVERMKTKLETERYRLEFNRVSLSQTSPSIVIKDYKNQVKRLLEIQQVSMQQMITHSRHNLALNAKLLDTLSPLNTLARGFTIAEKKGEVIKSSKNLKSGDEIDLRFVDGRTAAKII